MFTVTKEKQGALILVKLVGSMEEQVSLESQIGPVDADLIINCRGVTRINSVGVKMWMRYFQTLREQGRKFTFTECPPAIVAQLNLISNFACGGEVESILLPFSCDKCKSDFVANIGTRELKKNNLLIPSVKCEKPDCAATFDDDPDEYLFFLEN
jgi:anti-anti-sigma regulatory factor